MKNRFFFTTKMVKFKLYRFGSSLFGRFATTFSKSANSKKVQTVYKQASTGQSEIYQKAGSAGSCTFVLVPNLRRDTSKFLRSG